MPDPVAKRSSKAAPHKAKAAPATPLDPYEVGPLGLFGLVDEDGREVAPIPDLPDGLAVRLLEAMLFQRALDQRMLNLQRQGRIGFYGTATGAGGAPPSAPARRSGSADWIFPALREGRSGCGGACRSSAYIAQCFGNAADATHGRQMPCHYSRPRHALRLALVACIGTQITHAAGAAMAAQIRGDDVVVGGYLGDGATSSNDFHAALNFAAVWKAPVVFVCQNNQWAISVPASKQTASETFAVKALALRHAGRCGSTATTCSPCYVAAQAAVDRARRGEGPTFIECLTYRLGGHSSSDDPTSYRDESEAKVWEGRDPLERHRTWLHAQGAWDRRREEDFLAEAGRRITDAITTVEAAGALPVESLFDNVYAELPPVLADQRDRLLGNEPV